jgi:hypothetical protein
MDTHARERCRSSDADFANDDDENDDTRANECDAMRCILGTHPSVSTTRGVDRARVSRERPSVNDSLEKHPSSAPRGPFHVIRRRASRVFSSSSETVEGGISGFRFDPLMTDAETSDANARDALDRRVKSLVARVSESTARRAHDKTVTPRFVSALAELAFRFTETCARDVRAYATHDGKRDVVTVKDVELRARRAPSRRARRGDVGDGDES